MSEWKQDLIGRYIHTDGRKLNVTREGLFLVFDIVDTDNGVFESFDSVEEVNEFLDSKGLPYLNVLPRSEPTEWFLYEKFEPTSVTQKVWCQSTVSKNIEVLMLLKWESGLYSVYLWDTGYEYDMHFECDMLDYVETFGKNPETDFDVAVVEATAHGASGMDKTWHDLTIDEAREILGELGVTVGL